MRPLWLWVAQRHVTRQLYLWESLRVPTECICQRERGLLTVWEWRLVARQFNFGEGMYVPNPLPLRSASRHRFFAGQLHSVMQWHQ